MLFVLYIGQDGQELPMYYENFDITSVVTPVNADRLEQLCRETNYDRIETQFLVNGFKNGFEIGCTIDVKKLKLRRTAPNLKLRVGNQTILWNKVMKEVKAGRYAGPFKEPPFPYFVQSPIGLVPKDKGKDTRLIFHLSYPRTGVSINSETPLDLCTVKYSDFS